MATSFQPHPEQPEPRLIYRAAPKRNAQILRRTFARAGVRVSPRLARWIVRESAPANWFR